jgi:hypothetical protein
VSRIYHLSENDNIPPHVSSEFARGDFKTLKLQLAAAMPPAARKHTIVKDNNHVVLEVLFDPGYVWIERASESLQGVIMPIRPRSGCLGANDERAAVEWSQGNIVHQRAVRVGLLRFA